MVLLHGKPMTAHLQEKHTCGIWIEGGVWHKALVVGEGGGGVDVHKAVIDWWG